MFMWVDYHPNFFNVWPRVDDVTRVTSSAISIFFQNRTIFNIVIGGSNFTHNLIVHIKCVFDTEHDA